MKRILALLMFAAAAMAQSAPNGNITLSWTDQNPPGAVQSFQIYSTTNAALPIASWPLLKSVPGNVTSTNLTVAPGVNFFAAKASNFWGQTDFSVAVSTPIVLSGQSSLSVAKAP